MCVRVATDKHTLCNVLFAAYELRGRLSAHCTIWTHSNGPGPKKRDPGRAIAADGGGWALLRPCSAIIIALQSQKVKEVMRYVNWYYQGDSG